MSFKSVELFIASCLLGGIGGAAGSMIGHAFGHRGVFIGGVAGGLAAAILVARLAAWRGWIVREQSWGTTLGAATGSLVAAFVATKTLSSPIGPILSTLLIGAGALIGSYAARPGRQS